ncbi:MAG TPA: 50S ribosomal protein L28 [Hyphomonadaceae bacterium]|nr:50S ribosomal protein L28 [Hyphomonadaceae bacterium]
MSRRCELTGVGVLVGHKVSHSNIKTKKRFLPNLVDVTFLSDSTGLQFRLRVAAKTLRSVDHVGGIDAFLLQSDETKMSDAARKARTLIKKKLAETAAAAA